MKKEKFVVCIYCYYNENGFVTKDVPVICRDLHKIADLLIVVINGKIDIDKISNFYADEIVFRENYGLDAGAYKSALFNKKYYELIKKSTGLILCNNSFWGPFIELSDIWSKMCSTPNVDFWGISSSEFELSQHIQSYFLVFNKRILEDDVLWNYFDKHIDEKETDYFMVCASFENGLFNELVRHGYVWDAFVKKIRCNPYENPMGSILLDKLPILKKKIFSSSLFNERIYDTIFIINNMYNYPVSIIFNSAKEIYGISNLHIQKMYNEKKVTHDLIENSNMIKREEVLQFIDKHDNVFIYGAGFFARYVFSTFFNYRNNPKLKGFLVTNKEDNIDCCGYPVYKYKNNMLERDTGIILAVSLKYTTEIISKIDFEGDILCLWKGKEE